MKMLLIHSYCFPTGGDWRYVESVANVFRDRGHEVSLFGLISKDKNYIPAGKHCLVNSKIYLYESFEKSVSLKALRNAFNVLFNVRVFFALRWHLDEFNPDIIQLNSIHTALSPSVLFAIAIYRYQNRCKVFWRMLDYKLVCPNRTLLDGNGVKCMKCVGKQLPYPVILKRCKNGKFAESFLMFLENSIINFAVKCVGVDGFLTQSEFSSKILRSGAFGRYRTKTIKNPVERPLALNESVVKKYDVIYFGRLSSEKGILEFLPKLIGLGLKVAIVGEGPELEKVKFVCLQNSRIDFLGPVWGTKLSETISRSCITIVPSLWFEVSPYVILESYRCGVPVLASTNGGSKDIIERGVTGEVFDPVVEGDFEEKLLSMLKGRKRYIPQKIQEYLTNNHSYEMYYEQFVKEVNR